jgi:ligand-binding sensor domain-containing protein
MVSLNCPNPLIAFKSPPLIVFLIPGGFTAEGFGVYRYDGKRFQQFTTEDGLTSNVTLSILEDHKGQLWFGSWQGLSIYDGQTFRDAQELEPWTR